MQFHKNDSALIVIDPQNDVLSEKGVSWGLDGESIRENNTVENLAHLSRQQMNKTTEYSFPPTTSTLTTKHGNSAGRSPWSRTRRRGQGTPNLATATRRRSPTTDFWRMQF